MTLQLELLTDNASPLLGLRVQVPTACLRCSGTIATINAGRGPHYAELRCACGVHSGWLSKSTAAWINTVISKFGCPTTPIVLRRQPGSAHECGNSPDNAGTSKGNEK